ncbi:MAG TPA: NADH-quinone oxidoreductase subunit J [Anaeromyxobacter sp.]
MRIDARKLSLWFIATLAVVVFLGYMTTQVIQPAFAKGGPAPSGPAGLTDFLFYVIAALTVAGALGVALSRNILYSAMGLLMALLGVGALYVYLAADFVAVTQLLIYIGGVLVLILFAVMLTNRITEVNVSNTSFGLFGGILLAASVAPVLVAVVTLTPWRVRLAAPAMAATTEAIGNGFLTTWLLPFEVASLVLLATLVGSIVIARKEIKAD